MQCNKCGNEVGSEELICNQCGNPLEPNNQADLPTEPNLDNDVPSDIELNMALSSDESKDGTMFVPETIEQDNDMTNEQSSNSSNKGANTKLTKSSSVVIIIVSCLTILVIGALILWVFSGKKNDTEIYNRVDGFINATSQLDLETMNQYVTPEMSERLGFITKVKALAESVEIEGQQDPEKPMFQITPQSIEVERVNGSLAYVEADIVYTIMGNSISMDTTFEMNKVDGEWVIKDIKQRAIVSE